MIKGNNIPLNFSNQFDGFCYICSFSLKIVQFYG